MYLLLKTPVENKDTENKTAFTKEEPLLPVSFKEVGAFANVKMLSAFLHHGEMVACGTESPDGALLPDLKSINLATGNVSNRQQKLGERQKNFGMQTLNIPQVFLEEGMTPTVLFFLRSSSAFVV